MNNGHCIYCGSPGPYSEEHAVPRSLGEFRGFPPLKSHVCVKCNGKIGKLEEQLGRTGPEAFFRKYLGIEGRDTHDTVNPFQRGSAGAKPIDFIGSHPSAGIEVLWEFNPGEKTVREVRQIVFVDENGKSYPVRIHEWMDSPEHVRSEIKKSGLKGKLHARVFASDEEMPWVERLVRGIGSGLIRLAPQPSATVSDLVATVHVTDVYFRAVAKVAFHYLILVANSIQGNESCFAPVREFIMRGGPVDDFVRQTRRPILTFPHPSVRPNGWGHVLLTEKQTGGVQGRLQFFLGPTHEPPTYSVQLTARRRRY